MRPSRSPRGQYLIFSLSALFLLFGEAQRTWGQGVARAQGSRPVTELNGEHALFQGTPAEGSCRDQSTPHDQVSCYAGNYRRWRASYRNMVRPFLPRGCDPESLTPDCRRQALGQYYFGQSARLARLVASAQNAGLLSRENVQSLSRVCSLPSGSTTAQQQKDWARCLRDNVKGLVAGKPQELAFLREVSRILDAPGNELLQNNLNALCIHPNGPSLPAPVINVPATVSSHNEVLRLENQMAENARAYLNFRRSLEGERTPQERLAIEQLAAACMNAPAGQGATILAAMAPPAGGPSRSMARASASRPQAQQAEQGEDQGAGRRRGGGGQGGQGVGRASLPTTPPREPLTCQNLEILEGCQNGNISNPMELDLGLGRFGDDQRHRQLKLDAASFLLEQEVKAALESAQRTGYTPEQLQELKTSLLAACRDENGQTPNRLEQALGTNPLRQTMERAFSRTETPSPAPSASASPGSSSQEPYIRQLEQAASQLKTIDEYIGALEADFSPEQARTAARDFISRSPILSALPCQSFADVFDTAVNMGDALTNNRVCSSINTMAGGSCDEQIVRRDFIDRYFTAHGEGNGTAPPSGQQSVSRSALLFSGENSGEGDTNSTNPGPTSSSRLGRLGGRSSENGPLSGDEALIRLILSDGGTRNHVPHYLCEQCRAKQERILVLRGMRAQILAEHKSLAALDQDGVPRYRTFRRDNLAPMLQGAGSDQGEAQRAIRLQLASIRENVAKVCAHPEEAGESVLYNPGTFEQFLNCMRRSTDPQPESPTNLLRRQLLSVAGSGEESTNQPTINRTTVSGCSRQITRAGAQELCDLHRSMTHDNLRAAAGIGLELTGAALDLSGCVPFVSGLASALRPAAAGARAAGRTIAAISRGLRSGTLSMPVIRRFASREASAAAAEAGEAAVAMAGQIADGIGGRVIQGGVMATGMQGVQRYSASDALSQAEFAEGASAAGLIDPEDARALLVQRESTTGRFAHDLLAGALAELLPMGHGHGNAHHGAPTDLHGAYSALGRRLQSSQWRILLNEAGRNHKHPAAASLAAEMRAHLQTHGREFGINADHLDQIDNETLFHLARSIDQIARHNQARSGGEGHYRALSESLARCGEDAACRTRLIEQTLTQASESVAPRQGQAAASAANNMAPETGTAPRSATSEGPGSRIGQLFTNAADRVTRLFRSWTRPGEDRLAADIDRIAMNENASLESRAQELRNLLGSRREAEPLLRDLGPADANGQRRPLDLNTLNHREMVELANAIGERRRLQTISDRLGVEPTRQMRDLFHEADNRIRRAARREDGSTDMQHFQAEQSRLRDAVVRACSSR